MEVAIGVDIGQKRDPTALCAATSETRFDDGRKTTHFLVRHLERLPLGTRYPEVARRVARLYKAATEKTESRVTVSVDATGVGQPIIDLLDEEGVEAIACYFTHGDRRTEKSHEEVTIGKAFLVSRLQSLLQTGRLHLPKSDEAQVLAQELQDYEIRVDENANDKYGAFKVGTHDDLVTALGLAVQVDRAGSSSYVGRLR